MFENQGTVPQKCYPALYPIIGLFSLLLFLTLVSIGVLAKDLLYRGCLTWHRNSLGQLLQQIIVFSCTLSSICKVTSYIKTYESEIEEPTTGVPSFWPCMTPMIVLCVLLSIKLFMFRTEAPFVYFAMILTLIGLAFAYETHFDTTRYESPIFILVLPFVFILICMTTYDLMKTYYEKDECK